MNTRLMFLVLGVLLAGSLLFNAIAVVVLLRQRSEIESLRAQRNTQPMNPQRVGDVDQPSELSQAAEFAPAKTRIARAQDAASDSRDAFLQKSFTNFQSITFMPATNSETVVQRLKVNTHMVTFKGRRYSGFQFTVPEWIDGDFEWAYFHLTNEQNKNRRVRAEWFILPEQGAMAKGFETYDLKPLTTYPLLKKRFPNSREAYRQTLKRERLKPGASYAIWFGYLDASNVPDIAVALTINSERGHNEFGMLPLK
jgi:hypothetical protein